MQRLFIGVMLALFIFAGVALAFEIYSNAVARHLPEQEEVCRGWHGHKVLCPGSAL